MSTTIKDALYNGHSPDQRQLIEQLSKLGIAAATLLVVTENNLWPDIADALVGFMDEPLGNIAIEAWDKHEEIQKLEKETLADPKKVCHVSVRDRTVRTTRKLDIALATGAVETVLFSFVLELALKIEEAAMTINAGRISRFDPAAATVTATLKAGNVELKRVELAKIQVD